MKRINNLVFFAGIPSLLLAAANVLLLSNFQAALQAGSPIPDWQSLLAAGIILLLGLYFLAGLAAQVLQFCRLRRENLLCSAGFVLGVFSLFLLAVDAIMLREIGNEAPTGFDSQGEWAIVFFNHGLHILSILVVFLGSLFTRRQVLAGGNFSPAMKDEALFLSVNQIGIFAPLLGLLYINFLNLFGIPAVYQKGLFLFVSLVVLLPYGLAAFFWLFSKRRERPVDWYDEKQFLDVSRAGLLTLLVSLLCLTGFYLLAFLGVLVIEVLVWFPVYLFLTLLVFSGSTLYLNKLG